MVHSIYSNSKNNTKKYLNFVRELLFFLENQIILFIVIVSFIRFIIPNYNENKKI